MSLPMTRLGDGQLSRQIRMPDAPPRPRGVRLQADMNETLQG